MNSYMYMAIFGIVLVGSNLCSYMLGSREGRAEMIDTLFAMGLLGPEETEETDNG